MQNICLTYLVELAYTALFKGDSKVLSTPILIIITVHNWKSGNKRGKKSAPIKDDQRQLYKRVMIQIQGEFKH